MTTKFQKDIQLIEADPANARVILSQRKTRINVLMDAFLAEKNKSRATCKLQEVTRLQKEYALLDSLV